MMYEYEEMPLEREYNAYRRRVVADPKIQALPREERERAIARKMLGLEDEENG